MKFELKLNLNYHKLNGFIFEFPLFEFLIFLKYIDMPKLLIFNAHFSFEKFFFWFSNKKLVPEFYEN